MLSNYNVHKAIIPVAGLGTRMLPASKSIPKELLPVFDRPAIQYVVDEAVAAGITEIILVTRGGKSVIEQYFDADPELEAWLEAHGKPLLAAEIRSLLPASVRLLSVCQQRPLGLGHAVLQAAHLVADKPVAVLLPDVLVDQADAASVDLAHMIRRFEATGASQILVEPVAPERVDQYGIVVLGEQAPTAGESVPIRGVVEKPQPGQAPSDLSVVGRYVLPARIMTLLQAVRPGHAGEIQLTDAIRALIAEQRVEAYAISGQSFDCGNKIGYLQAFLHYALKHPQAAGEARRVLAAADPD